MSARYFLGAISPEGFFSYYSEIINLREAKRVYLIKSGPGSGKSTFMRRVAELVTKAGQEAEYIHCSSDPDSLDGVVFPALKSAIMDATPPHVTEPAYAGVVERYLPLCRHTDFTGIEKDRLRIMELTDSNRACYPRCYRCLRAVGALRADVSGLVITPEALAKIERRVKGIIAREIRRGSGQGKEVKRFLNAYTPKGAVCLYDTADELCPRIYDIEDHYGLAELLLRPLMRAAMEAGHDVVTCYDPMSSGTELGHLLIPSLGLGFVTSNEDGSYPGTPYRRVRLDACLSPEPLHDHRQRLRFLKRTERALMSEAFATLAQAKAYHDELEALYHPYVRFDTLLEEAEAVAAELLALQ